MNIDRGIKLGLSGLRHQFQRFIDWINLCRVDHLIDGLIAFAAIHAVLLGGANGREQPPTLNLLFYCDAHIPSGASYNTHRGIDVVSIQVG